MTPSTVPIIAPGSIVAQLGHKRLYRVHGESRDGSVCCWGPLTEDHRNSPRARWRAFRPAELRIVTPAAVSSGGES